MVLLPGLSRVVDVWIRNAFALFIIVSEFHLHIEWLSSQILGSLLTDVLR